MSYLQNISINKISIGSILIYKQKDINYDKGDEFIVTEPSINSVKIPHIVILKNKHENFTYYDLYKDTNFTNRYIWDYFYKPQELRILKLTKLIYKQN